MRSILLCTLLLGCCALRCAAQDEPIDPVIQTDPARVRSLIGQLDAQSWLERDLATIELGQLDPGITLEQLEAFLDAPSLSLEQRIRLVGACLARYAQSPKGALGVSFGTIRVGAIEVQPIGRDPNFPASMMLLPGDRIAMVGDRIMLGTQEIRAEILSREPGEKMPVTLLRQDRVLHMDLPLGAFNQLTGAARLDPKLLGETLMLRWERKGINPGLNKDRSPIGEEISTQDWSRAAFPQDATPNPRVPDRRSPRAILVGPEMTLRLAPGSAISFLQVWDAPGSLIKESSERAMLLEAEQIQSSIALRLLIEKERDQLLNERESAPSPEERQRLTDRVNELTARLDAISAELDRMRQQHDSPAPPTPGREP